MLRLFFVFIWDNECFHIIGQAKAAYPLTGIGLIENVDMRLRILVCNIVQISDVTQQILNNKIRINLLYNVKDSMRADGAHPGEPWASGHSFVRGLL